MTANLYANLSWLPPAPGDFAARCRSGVEGEEELGKRLQALAAHALDENQLSRLANVIGRARVEGRSLAPLIPFRLGIVSNATSHFLVPALIASAARYGFALECVEADFDQVVQETLSADSAINKAQPNAVLIAVDYRGLPLNNIAGDAEAAGEAVAATVDHLDMIRSGIRANSKAVCIVQTLVRPTESLFGSFDMVFPGTLRRLIDAANRRIGDSIAGSSGDVLFDVAALAETVGLAAWNDHTFWNIAKLPFSSIFLPLYADHMCRLIAALRGKSRRCLILDLDNTLWGGVVGDDGLDGIVIGQGDPTGEAHLAVQRAALSLRDRGVVLAVSSKNNDEVAREPFRQHPEMLLREEHIAVFQANWEDKATNIRAIADELSLGFDAMVLLDDNPAERALVRQILPEVAVPELPADPALYARTLLAAGYFEAVAFSSEDRQRAEYYQENARRAVLRKRAGDLEGYLASLKMVMTVQPFDGVGRARIAQLVSKSNQFNLMTRRYTADELAEIERDPTCLTMQVRLADIFGDNGMICVVICRVIAGDWEVDTWLMSCRVLGRQVEKAVLQEIINCARRAGIQKIVGVYRPTSRNALVKDHYAKLGFTFIEQRPDGTTTWVLDVGETPGEALPMEIRRLGGFGAVQ